MHEDMNAVVEVARSLVENDSPHMDNVAHVNSQLFDDHIEAGYILADRVDDFTRAVWATHAKRVQTPADLSGRFRGVKSEEALAALGSLEPATTDVDAVRSLVVDVGIVASYVFMREGCKHYSLTGE